MPSFDNWAQVVGGILEVGAVKGFLANSGQCVAELDTEAAEVKALVEIWLQVYAYTSVTARQLHQLARENNLFTWIDAAQTRRFGKMLRRYENRVFGDVQIVKVGEVQRAALYALKGT